MRALLRLLASASPILALGGAVLAAPLAYISNSGSNDVSVIDTATDTVVATVAVGNYPRGVAVDRTGTRIYVANYSSDTVSVIDGPSRNVVATIALAAGSGPSAVAVNPAGTRVYVTNTAIDSVSVIDATTNSVVAMVTLPSDLHHPNLLVVHPGGSRVYVTGTWQNSFGSMLAVIDTTSNLVSRSMLTTMATGMVVNPAGTRLYVGGFYDIAVYDATTDSLLTTMGINWVSGLAINPTGTRLYVSRYFEALDVVDTATHGILASMPFVEPVGLNVHPFGRRVYVADHTANTVTVVDTLSNTIIRTIPVGIAPTGMGQFIRPTIPCAAFVDVDMEDPFCASVEWLRNRAVTLGCANDWYCPDETTSRVGMAAFLARLGGALANQVVWREQASGAIDLDAGVVVCQSADVAIAGFPRRAYTDAVLSATGESETGFAAAAVASFDGGATWLPTGGAPRAAAAVDRWGAVRDFGILDVEVGQTVRFGVRVNRDGMPGTPDLADSRCVLRVVIGSRNGTSSPYEVRP